MGMVGLISTLPVQLLDAVPEKTTEILDDFEIDYGNKTIRYLGKTDNIYTVNELYEALQKAWDDPVTLDGPPMEPMSPDDPRQGKFITIWGIDNE